MNRNYEIQTINIKPKGTKEISVLEGSNALWRN